MEEGLFLHLFSYETWNGEPRPRGGWRLHVRKLRYRSISMWRYIPNNSNQRPLRVCLKLHYVVSLYVYLKAKCILNISELLVTTVLFYLRHIQIYLIAILWILIVSSIVDKGFVIIVILVFFLCNLWYFCNYKVFLFENQIYTQTKVKQHHIFSETMFWKLQNGICG